MVLPIVLWPWLSMLNDASSYIENSDGAFGTAHCLSLVTLKVIKSTEN